MINYNKYSQIIFYYVTDWFWRLSLFEPNFLSFLLYLLSSMRPATSCKIVHFLIILISFTYLLIFLLLLLAILVFLITTSSYSYITRSTPLYHCLASTSSWMRKNHTDLIFNGAVSSYLCPYHRTSPSTRQNHSYHNHFDKNPNE